MKGKNVLVVGLGISGIAAVKALDTLGANISAYDGQDEKKLKEKISELGDINVKYYFDNLDFNAKQIDLVIKSPGIKFDTPIMKKLIESDVEIIGDLEAGFVSSSNKFVAITGTNGKTTTTTLIGEILKYADKKHKITGNIGSGVFWDALNSEPEEILVAETSSFQLESTMKFKPFISIITNLTPDHLDWHGSEDNYYLAKFKAAKNQDKNDYCILNDEDDLIKKYAISLNTNIVYFNASKELNEGVFVKNGKIIFKFDKDYSEIMKVEDVFIPGKHNLENVLAACGAAKLIGVSNEDICEAISSFRGVEHRLEYVDTFNGVKYFNDSKGTNPDASIKAVLGLEYPLVLIAGGYDKNSEYDDFVKSFGNKVKHLILMGETKEKIKACCLKHGFKDIIEVENMDEAVRKCFELSVKGDAVLLSPACASWGMYDNYEIRGRDFKERVNFYGKYQKEEKNL